MRRIVRIGCVLAVSALGACGPRDAPTGINDPFEEQNRQVHRLNTELDKALVRPASNAYGSSMPEPVRLRVSNFSNNLSLPAMVANDLLQLKFEDAISNSSRLLLNSTVGLLGLYDPASSIGITERDNDFGHTLHTWGVGEGRYMELPFVGPSTERDAMGMIVDTLFNPTTLLFQAPEKTIATAADVAAKMGQRYQYSDFVDSILYDSADSYAQARLLYLQSRRFELSGSETPDYADPYADTYEDPYAQ